jgi:hypothetical protein
MEEKGREQTCIAMVPFNDAIAPAYSRDQARRDADMIVRALNAAILSTAGLVERLTVEAANLEQDIDHGEPNEAVYRAKVEQLRADAAAILSLTAEAKELRAERDALLEKPIDLSKMDSIDEGVPDKMLAYYWHEQAQEARARNKALEEALREGLTFAVLFLAFDGRDRHTDRMDKTLDALNEQAVAFDAKARAALNHQDNRQKEGGE